MKHKAAPSQPENPGRRDALRRLAGAVITAYVVPEILFLSAARAGEGSSSASSPSAPTEPSSTSTPEPSSPSTSASGPEGQGDDDDFSDDNCNVQTGRNGNAISISRSDLSRSEEAIQAGFAKPLDQIWGPFSSNYSGKVVSVEFSGGGGNARYRFRSISARGRLETVVVSAQTGEILQIVGC